MDLTTAANDIRRARRLLATVKKLGGVWLHSLGRIICTFRGFFVFIARRDREELTIPCALILLDGALLIERYPRRSRIITNDKHFNYALKD